VWEARLSGTGSASATGLQCIRESIQGLFGPGSLWTDDATLTMWSVRGMQSEFAEGGAEVWEPLDISSAEEDRLANARVV
jgi:hypothetical protein